MTGGHSWATRGETVHVADCEMHVVEREGAGRPVVFVHGLGASAAIWDRLIDHLPADRRIIAVDLRGAGQTRETDGATPLSPELWARDLHAGLTQVEAIDAVVVGHSLGATVALEAALRWPESVAGVGLLCMEARLGTLGPRMQRSADMIRRLGMDRWVQEHWAKNPPFSDASLEADPALLDEYRTMLLANRPDDYMRACEAIVHATDLTSRLGDVTQPAVVVVGSQDDRTLPEEGRRLADALPDAEFVAIEDVGHTVPMEAPGAAAAAIRTLLARLDEVTVAPRCAR